MLSNERRSWAGVMLAIMLGACGSPDRGVMAELDRLPAIVAIKRFYPEDYNRIEQSIAALGSNGSLTARQAAVASAVQGVMSRERPKADGESAYRLFSVTREEGAALRKVDPAGCASFMEGQGSTSLSRVLTPEMTARDGEAVTSLLAQTRARPAQPAAALPESELLRLLGQAAGSLDDRERATVAALFRSERDPATAAENLALCDFDLAVADLILNRPKAEAGAMIRSFWSTTTATEPPKS